MGESDPMMTLTPLITAHPSGVFAAAAAPAADAALMLEMPVPCAMHQPKSPKQANGMMMPLTVKM